MESVNIETVKSVSIKNLKHFAGTDVGRRREENQDNYAIIFGDKFRFYIVADGMGGAKGGAVASALAVTTIRDEIKKDGEIDAEITKFSIEKANTIINDKGVADPRYNGMGTTLVGLLFVEDRLILCNVGDSRAYKITKEGISQLTQDHTLVQEMVKAGSITPEQAESHPISHMLTRSLGPSPEVEVDCWEIEKYSLGDRYLLCSDGLYNLVKEHEYQGLIEKHGLELVVPELIKLANQRGGTDNITVIIVNVDPALTEKVEEIGVKREEDFIANIPILYSDTVKIQRPTSNAFENILNGTTGAQEEDARSADRRNYQPLLIIVLSILGAFIGGGILGPKMFNRAEKIEITQGKNKVQEELKVEIAEAKPTFNNPTTQESDIVLLKKREQALNARLFEIKRRLSYFEINEPLKVNLFIKETSKAKESYNLELQTLKRELESLARKLTVWYERKEKLVTVDPINLATELAAISDSIKVKKEYFEKITSEYLAIVEKLRYEPENKELEEEVAQLISRRNIASKELGDEIKELVIKETSSGERQIAEKTIKKNGLEDEVRSIEEDLIFIQDLNKLDVVGREEILKEVNSEIEKVELELGLLKDTLR